MRVSVPDNQLTNANGYVMANYARNLTKAAVAFSQAAFMHSRLSFREFEGARTRVALINGCLTCQGFRPARELGDYLEAGGNAGAPSVAANGPAPDEAYYEAVSEWRSSAIFSDRERLAIEYAERIALDPQGVAYDEPLWSRMKQAFTDDELVDFNCCIAGWLGLGRLTHALGLDGFCGIAAAA